MTTTEASSPIVPARETGGVRHVWEMPFGTRLLPEGGVCFRLWAPEARTVELLVWRDGTAHLQKTDALPRGWHQASLPDAGAGTRYQWRIDSATVVPDPASRFNPEGPHRPSQVVDPAAFDWQDDWKGRPWSEVVLYEMHVGTFTEAGTYAAAEGRLAELADTGVTALELMPLSDFPGRFGWGYDGVLPYAPHAPYGSPDELKHFIRAAHRHGLMVFLDVVYNHFGPDGNYLGLYAPQFFSKVHTNPWGNSLNFDREGSDTVRAFFVQNALYWLQEYRFDGLRLDAIHAIVDDSALDVIDELALRVHQAIPDRHVHLVLENENNGHQRLPAGGQYDAQWNDDFHHVVYVALSGDTAGYYQDFDRRPVALLARCLTHGFLWEGSRRDPEGARLDLQAAPAQPLGAMVNFLNNHDQSGNRAFGERFGELVPAEAVPLATALMLLSPATPMLFAGEEFGSRAPFLYFADWEGELKRMVVEGRARDFGQFARRADGRTAEPPPACDPETFEASRIDWATSDRDDRARARRGFVRDALAARREWFTPRLPRLIHGAHVAHMQGERAFVLRWRYENAQTIELRACLSPVAIPAPDASGVPWLPLAEPRTVFSTGEIGDRTWQPWSAHWTFGREHG